MKIKKIYIIPAYTVIIEEYQISEIKKDYKIYYASDYKYIKSFDLDLVVGPVYSGIIKLLVDLFVPGI